MPFGPAQGSGSSSLGTTVEVSEIESLSDGHIIIGDGSGAPTTRAAFASSTGNFTPGSVQIIGKLDNSAASPTYSFSGFTNGGMYSGDGLVKIAISGALALAFGAGQIYLGSLADVALARNAADILEVNSGTAGAFRDLRVRALLQSGANGQASTLEQLTEAHTLAAAGTSDTTIQVPAGAMVVGVGVRVTTAITGCDTIDVGIAGATTRYGTGIAVAANTTNATCGTVSAPVIYQSATAIRFTAVGGGAAFTAGVVRITIHFVRITAPTS